MGESMQVAVASREGMAISEHFGHARQFWIYQVDGQGATLLEQRQVEHYCLGNSANQSAMSGILEAVRDCKAVFVAKIGDGPRDKLAAIGVAAVDDYPYAEIDDALQAWWGKQA